MLFYVIVCGIRDFLFSFLNLPQLDRCLSVHSGLQRLRWTTARINIEHIEKHNLQYYLPRRSVYNNNIIIVVVVVIIIIIIFDRAHTRSPRLRDRSGRSNIRDRPR